ncbi:tripartite tricarboxylate transporter substrate binding protein [Pelagibius sp. Alg239-R121]|uniref:tripartite tricarboxylate transporter substrate binding protein n=1 Tax=Pelagibius sp. Alg239-R121 TaxID=2993448 RepID=UPI0024A6AE99|nr:tripartite tricarboxylate transporter substrate binding protein [Pelagibius sp. Alg239-R121]
MKRRSFFAGLVAAATVTAVATGSLAADWPRRPINLVVPYKAGGGTDAYARAISAAAEGVLDVPVVVVNKPGSGGLNGANAVVRAKPDGYTMMMTSGGSFLLSTMMRETKIDALESFDFVAQVGQLKTSIMVPKDSPFQSVQDVIDAAKAKPGSLRWAHSGRGGFHFVAGLGFLAKNDIEAQDVPFKGGGPTRAALIGAQADFGFLGVQQLAGFEEQLRALAVNSKDRDEIMAAVPSFGELGVPFAAVSSPVIVFAPKGTPSEIVTKLETALEKITAKPEFAELLVKRGTGPVYQTGSDAKTGLTTMKADAEPLIAGLGK